MLIILSGLNTIDSSLYEAARTMGARGWARFRLITLPLIWPAVSTVVLMRSIEMWKEFVFPFFLAPSFPVFGTLIENIYRWRQPERASVVAIILLICVVFSSGIAFYGMKIIRRQIIKV